MHTERVVYRHPWGETVNVTAYRVNPLGDVKTVLTSLSRPTGNPAHAGWVFDVEERARD